MYPQIHEWQRFRKQLIHLKLNRNHHPENHKSENHPEKSVVGYQVAVPLKKLFPIKNAHIAHGSMASDEDQNQSVNIGTNFMWKVVKMARAKG